MAWLTRRSNSRLVVSAAVCPHNSSPAPVPFSGLLSKGLKKNGLPKNNKVNTQSQLGLIPSANTKRRWDLFDDMKHRFLSFKKHKFLKEFKHFQALAEVQSPKFMVIACADSRVCPSNVLGFQPGEAFVVRNVANLVPPLENGPSETNAALEFAVNTLQVENILIMGHSSCGGIQSLMSMQEDQHSRWVIKGKVAKLKTKSEANHLGLEEQCRHCEKESVNVSLQNLLSYPWIKDRAKRGLLSIHGGYYDFFDCTFQKWTLHFHASKPNYSIKDQAIWS